MYRNIRFGEQRPSPTFDISAPLALMIRHPVSEGKAVLRRSASEGMRRIATAPFNGVNAARHGGRSCNGQSLTLPLPQQKRKIDGLRHETGNRHDKDDLHGKDARHKRTNEQPS